MTTHRILFSAITLCMLLLPAFSTQAQVWLRWDTTYPLGHGDPAKRVEQVTHPDRAIIHTPQTVTPVVLTVPATPADTSAPRATVEQVARPVVATATLVPVVRSQPSITAPVQQAPMTIHAPVPPSAPASAMTRTVASAPATPAPLAVITPTTTAPPRLVDVSAAALSASTAAPAAALLASQGTSTDAMVSVTCDDAGLCQPSAESTQVFNRHATPPTGKPDTRKLEAEMKRKFLQGL